MSILADLRAQRPFGISMPTTMLGRALDRTQWVVSHWRVRRHLRMPRGAYMRSILEDLLIELSRFMEKD